MLLIKIISFTYILDYKEISTNIKELKSYRVDMTEVEMLEIKNKEIKTPDVLH